MSCAGGGRAFYLEHVKSSRLNGSSSSWDPCATDWIKADWADTTPGEAGGREKRLMYVKR